MLRAALAVRSLARPLGLRAAHARASSTATGAPDGTLFTWGTNSEGQLGLGPSGETRLTPERVEAPEPMRFVDCGATTTAAVGASGNLYTWGKCEYFSLGHGETTNESAVPMLVRALAGIPMTAVSCGTHHMAALSDEGEVYTWGYGGSWFSGQGALGHGDTTDQPEPALVESLAEDGHKIIQIACGGKHTLALTTDGLVMGWGNGTYGRLGNGKSRQKYPEVVELLEDKKVVQIAAGGSFSMALTDSGELYCWGKNDQSQLGLGANLTMDINSMEEYPLRNDLFKTLDDPDDDASGAAGGDGAAAGGARWRRPMRVAAGKTHSLAITDDGLVFYWGARQHIEPHAMTVLKDKPAIVDVAAGENLSAALTVEGDLYTWGKGRLSGALGHGGRSAEKQPRRLEFFDGVSVASVACGGKHCAAITGPAPATARRRFG